MRGLLVTPWFAAASGFVIAASLWIYSPHPQLTFPAIAIGKVPCNSDGCSSPFIKQGAGSLTIKSDEPVAPRHNSARAAKTGTRPGTRTAASGLTFGYVVHPAADSNFVLVVSVAGKRPIKNWHLAFTLPGDHIRSVYWAHWMPQGPDGGIASAFTGNAGEQAGGPGDSGGGQGYQGGSQGDYAPGGANDRARVIFTVIASGTPAGPTQCSFDGASCTFHELSGASQGAR